MSVLTDEPQHLRGMRALRFHAESFDVEDDLTVVVAQAAVDFIAAHREEFCPLRIEFDQWQSSARGKTPADRLLNDLGLGKSPTPWHATATLYYDAVSEEVEGDDS